MTNDWRMRGPASEVGDEAAGGLPTARGAVGFEQMGSLGPEADRAVVAHVGVDVGVEHPPAGHGLEEALARQVATGGFEHLVYRLVEAPHQAPDVIGVGPDPAAERRLVVGVERVDDVELWERREELGPL